MSDELKFLSNVCACLGPQASDPYCPCRMQREGLDGYFNCYGNKEAQEKRRVEDEKRFTESMKRFGEHMNRRAGETG